MLHVPAQRDAKPAAARVAHMDTRLATLAWSPAGSPTALLTATQQVNCPIRYRWQWLPTPWPQTTLAGQAHAPVTSRVRW